LAFGPFFIIFRYYENSIGEKLYTKDEVLDLLVNMNSWPTTFEGREDITEWFEQGQYD